MHKIQEKEFTLDDFSCEHLLDFSWNRLTDTIEQLNYCREKFINYDPEDEKTIHPAMQYKKKDYWWQMIQLLPSSYNQTRNVMMNYEVLANIYKSRKDHKLDEWKVHKTPEKHEFRNKDFASGKWGFCDWIETLPYSELITSKKDLVEVTRCKDCKYYISEEDMKNNEMYKDYNNVLGYDGLCISTDKWTDETDFCSSGKGE